MTYIKIKATDLENITIKDKGRWEQGSCWHFHFQSVIANDTATGYREREVHRWSSEGREGSGESKDILIGFK